jgi:Protein of unknown function (DUF4233)
MTAGEPPPVGPPPVEPSPVESLPGESLPGESLPGEPLPARRPRSLRRSFAAMVLVGEILVVAFATLLARAVTDLPGRSLGLAGGAVVLLAVAAAGTLRSRLGYLLGWLVQLALLVSTAWVPTMGLLGVLFGGLWTAALVLGGRADEVTARRLAGVADGATGDAR